MPRLSHTARPVEKGDGYICSRCRQPVELTASACPHCQRNLSVPTAPFANGMLFFGIILFVLGVISVFYFALAGQMPGGSQLPPVSLGLGVAGVGMVAAAFLWDTAYPMLWAVYWIGRVVLWYAALPFRLIGSVILRFVMVCTRSGRAAGSKVMDGTRWLWRGAADAASNLGGDGSRSVRSFLRTRGSDDGWSGGNSKPSTAPGRRGARGGDADTDDDDDLPPPERKGAHERWKERQRQEREQRRED